MYKAENKEHDKCLKMIIQIRDLIPLEDVQIIHIQTMTELEKIELIICINEVMRSLVYIL
jgi:hypothetical protein